MATTTINPRNEEEKVFCAIYTIQAAQTPISIRVEQASNPVKGVINGGRIRQIEYRRSIISAQIHARILGYKDSVFSVSIDGVGRDLGVGNPANHDSATGLGVTNCVPHDPGI